MRRSCAGVLLALVAACSDTAALPGPEQGAVVVFSGPDLAPSVHAALAARSAAVTDLDGDGHLDVVTAGLGQQPVAVLAGSNHFNEITYEGPMATSIVVKDMDGDGLPDVVTGNDRSSVSVYKNLGAGVLGAPTSYAGGNGYIAVGDFDGDGMPDVAAAMLPLLTIMLNRGGALVTSQQFQPPSGPWRIATADVNEDGILDLVTTDADIGVGTIQETFSVRLGHGDGTFADAVAYPVGAASYDLALADVDGDHHVDVILDQTRDIVVARGAGDGTFTVVRTTPLTMREAIAPIAVGPCAPNDCQLFIGGPTLESLQLADPTSIPVSRAPHTNLNVPWQILVTDVDGDAAPDVLVVDATAYDSIP